MHRTEVGKNEVSDSSADIFNQRPTTPHFYISWKHVVTRPEYRERPRATTRPSCLNPPDLKEAFLPSEPSPCYVWSPGRLSPVSHSDKKYMIDYKVTSIFWRPDHQTYLTVPYDCTRYSVRDTARKDVLDDWAPLRFNHETYNGQCVSVVGHCFPNQLLAASGPQSWTGELIPYIHQRHEPPAIVDAQGPSLLAGDISIIMALAALSNGPELVKETIERSFRPPDWLRHGNWNRSGEQFYAFPA
jgi:WD40 repeat protein